jgi:thiol:disulfide interchange protein
MKTLWFIFLEGLLNGFLAFLMPCIFPLLPLTISFFTKSSTTRLGAITKALLYGLSIIIIYCTLGVLITAVLGPSGLNELASSAIFNLFIFALLVIFAISFLGAFDINLPSGFVNKIDGFSGGQTWIGIFFMAFTLALVSFSCTGPLVGNLLVDAVHLP